MHRYIKETMYACKGLLFTNNDNKIACQCHTYVYMYNLCTRVCMYVAVTIVYIRIHIYVPHIYYTRPLTSCTHPWPNHLLLAAVNQSSVPLHIRKVNICAYYTSTGTYVFHMHALGTCNMYLFEELSFELLMGETYCCRDLSNIFVVKVLYPVQYIRTYAPSTYVYPYILTNSVGAYISIVG